METSFDHDVQAGSAPIVPFAQRLLRCVGQGLTPSAEEASMAIQSWISLFTGL
jgi:hypothetical protein